MMLASSVRARAGLALVLAFALAAVGLSSACRKDPATGAAPPRPRIAVVPKGSTHEHWKAVHAGALAAGREEDVEIVWKGPLREDDLKEQIDLVNGLVAQRVAGLVLAPLNDKALAGPVRAAAAAGIPVVVIDSGLEGASQVSFVATDNEAAGRLAAGRAAAALGDKGKLAVLRYQIGSESTSRREAGFLAEIARHPGVEIVSSNQYGGATVETAFRAAESLLAAHGAAGGGVQALFTPNESTTFGALLALRKAGLVGKVQLVGFDLSAKLAEAVRAGEIAGVVIQDPFRMGHDAVATMAAHLRRQPIRARIDTGARLVTRETIDAPEIKAMLAPGAAGPKG